LTQGTITSSFCMLAQSFVSVKEIMQPPSKSSLPH
jgi:hypothetical protein